LPQNFRCGARTYVPSMIIIALGEPGVPVICFVLALGIVATLASDPNDRATECPFMSLYLSCSEHLKAKQM
jgi:hypothetical protein